MDTNQPQNTNPTYQTVSTQQPPEQDHHAYRMVVVTVVVILLGLTVYFITSRTNIFSSLTGKSNPNSLFTKFTNKDDVGQPAPFDSKKVWLEVTAESTKGKVNENMTLVINGFSEGKDVNGYDILFAVNSQEFEIISAESVLPTFQIFKFTKDDHVTFTAMKSMNAKDKTVLNNTPVLKIVVKPKKRGKINFSIMPFAGKEKTKFVDSNIQVSAPQVKSVQVAID